ncbi:MAG: hypothetical protein ACE5JB_07730 [bacterium]
MKVRKLFVVIFSVFILFGSCSGEQPENAKKELSVSAANHLTLIPKETNVLCYINFENLKKSPLGEDLSKELELMIKEEREDEEYLEFVEKTGLDLKRDIYDIWLAVFANNENDEEGGVIARGKFNRKKIIDYLKEEKHHEFREKTYLDYKIYLLEDNDDTAMVFLNDETIALGKIYWLRKVIAQSKNDKTSILNNSVMTELMDRVQYKDQMWGILNLKELSGKWSEEIRKRGSGFKGTQSIENMQWIIFHTQVDQKASIFIEGNFNTKEEAQLLAEMLNGFKAMAKLSVSDDKEAVDMLNDIKIIPKGSILNVTAKIDKEFFEKMEQNRKKFGNTNFDWL